MVNDKSAASLDVQPSNQYSHYRPTPALFGLLVNGTGPAGSPPGQFSLAMTCRVGSSICLLECRGFHRIEPGLDQLGTVVLVVPTVYHEVGNVEGPRAFEVLAAHV